MAEELYSFERHDGVRMPWNFWPRSKVEALKCVLPFSVLYTPLKQTQNTQVRTSRLAPSPQSVRAAPMCASPAGAPSAVPASGLQGLRRCSQSVRCRRLRHQDVGVPALHDAQLLPAAVQRHLPRESPRGALPRVYHHRAPPALHHAVPAHLHLHRGHGRVGGGADGVQGHADAGAQHDAGERPRGPRVLRHARARARAAAVGAEQGVRLPRHGRFPAGHGGHAARLPLHGAQPAAGPGRAVRGHPRDEVPGVAGGRGAADLDGAGEPAARCIPACERPPQVALHGRRGAGGDGPGGIGFARGPVPRAAHALCRRALHRRCAVVAATAVCSVPGRAAGARSSARLQARAPWWRRSFRRRSGRTRTWTRTRASSGAPPSHSTRPSPPRSWRTRTRWTCSRARWSSRGSRR